jgi:PHD/YefM family antitoxin component YafN of YafNO toxin-antitoxin module
MGCLRHGNWFSDDALKGVKQDMMVKPFAAIRDNYREIADFCIETGQPVFLTEDDGGELVVMSVQAWEKELRKNLVEETLLEIETEEKNGIIKYTPLEQVFESIDHIISEAEAAAV